MLKTEIVNLRMAFGRGSLAVMFHYKNDDMDWYTHRVESLIPSKT